MNDLTTAILVVAASGAFGAIVMGMAARTSHKLRLPFIGVLLEMGFVGDALLGAAASVAVFLFAAPLLSLSVASEQAADAWIKLVSFGVLCGLGGVKLLTTSSAYVVERLALLGDRMEQMEKTERSGELVRRADLMAAENRFEHALATYDEALRIDGRNESALIGKAKVLAERSQWPKALASVNRALELNPSSARAYYERARYKNMTGTYPKEQVLQDLKSAVLLDSHYKNSARYHDRYFESLRNAEEFRQIVE